MNKEKGNLSIHSENIFPIIKKWLYSDQDIFIRELISNACDAITKVKRLSSLGEADLGDNTDFQVKVVLNKTAKTLKFIDNGIGMTEEEVKKYINQIAFSGAEDFLKTYKDKGDVDQIIGHFGLGFYSSFMVAETVEINTLSYKQDALAVKWRCDGRTEFEMENSSKDERGTEITLYLGEEGGDFLNEYTVKSTIEKYCSFMPYPIYFEVADKEPEKDKDGNLIVEEPEVLNDVTPLYSKQPSSCTDEEYKEFYRKTFRDFQEPLFWIHLNMDYPFNLKGILYFPKLNTEFDTMEGRIKLYNNQVFVADNIKEVIPEFLLLLKGVIDCPDLPLNVSRSFLQNDGFTRKISDYITKKVADKLNSLFKSEREGFEKFWEDISPFIKYGVLKDSKFYEKVASIILYKTTNQQYITLEEYLEKYGEKLDKQVYYVSDDVQQAQYIKMLQEYELEAVILDHNIDSAFISHMEMKKKDIGFKRVDSNITELMKDKDQATDGESSTKEAETLTKVFSKTLGKEDCKVQLESLKSQDVAGMIILSEESRRMQEMMKRYSMGGLNMGAMPTEEILVLNKKHPLIQYILEHAEEETELLNCIVQQVYDLAVMGHKPLSPEAMTNFIKRSHEIMKQLIL
ncbi:molecular chaperone HtpG [Clostridium formicaceticum]|uniref:Chaperone protein HtpG n=1 Tax=Clostridium formicaceticum TaxID=1497 RepID=A0AAC9WIE4_9CLOT|nr:molecular chaperone HtpG [Clostridium formicaceticum]AOY75290.1 molecular chaperone HtpG [Clostridium formicaceticum]ARE89729.1 Chaperone protein HtpG [Clostridium formicaceticum]